MQRADGLAIAADEGESRLYRRVILRIIPFIFVCYVLNYIDRVNVSFAKLQFQSDLGLSDASYGLGVGLFYVRLHPFRGAKQSGSAKDWRAKDDHENYDLVGRDLDGHGFRI